MKYLILFSSILFITSCTTIDVFEKSKSFSDQSWNSNDTANFSFEITDTTSFYNFYMILRHTEKYPYKNIWLELTVKDGVTPTTFKREFILADASKWLATATVIDDIIDHRIIFNPEPIKLKKGIYSFTLKQIMRENPLPYILSAGVRVQKIVK